MALLQRERGMSGKAMSARASGKGGRESGWLLVVEGEGEGGLPVQLSRASEEDEGVRILSRLGRAA